MFKSLTFDHSWYSRNEVFLNISLTDFKAKKHPMNQSLLTNPSFNVDGKTKNIGHNLDTFSMYAKRGCGEQILESMSLPPATAFSGYEMFFIQKIHTRLEALVKLISTGISAYSFSFLNLYEKTFKNNVTTIYSGDVIFKNRNTIHLETQIQNKKQRNILLSSLCKREFQDKTVLG